MTASSKQQKLIDEAQALYLAGELTAAIDKLRRYVHLRPTDTERLSLLGRLMLRVGDFSAGIAHIERSLRIHPEQPEVRADLGHVFALRGEDARALQEFELALRKQPSALAFNNRGLLHYRRGDMDAALSDFEAALKLSPRLVDAWVNKGSSLSAKGLGDDAIAAFETALGLDPDAALAHAGLSLALRRQRRLPEALHSIKRALDLRPDMAGLWHNYGCLQLDLYALSNARQAFERALVFDPEYAESIVKLGQVSGMEGNIEAALSCFERAKAYEQQKVSADWSRALLLLLQGDFEQGWRLHENRLALEPGRYRCPESRSWLGEQGVESQRLLILREQGLGDFIQFCRYFPVLVARGAHVIVETPAPLLPLMASLSTECEFVPAGAQQYPPHDLHCRVASLPLACGTTSLERIPSATPYLQADPSLREIWRDRLGPRTRLRIGLAWSGSATHTNDYQRSIPLELLTPVLALNADFHAVQKEIRAADRLFAQGIPNLRLYDDALETFGDTAALISELDLVISVDTSLAHLAGALGESVWILLDRFPDFRWLRDRQDSPWYPTATLFRQTSGEQNWGPLIMRLAQTLKQTFNLESGTT